MAETERATERDVRRRNGLRSCGPRRARALENARDFGDRKILKSYTQALGDNEYVIGMWRATPSDDFSRCFTSFFIFPAVGFRGERQRVRGYVRQTSVRPMNSECGPYYLYRSFNSSKRTFRFFDVASGVPDFEGRCRGRKFAETRPKVWSRSVKVGDQIFFADFTREKGWRVAGGTSFCIDSSTKRVVSTPCAVG